MRGAPARAIQELAGHVDLSMTQRYMHLSPAALDAAIRLLEQPAGPAHAGHSVADARQTVQSFGDMLETGLLHSGRCLRLPQMPNFDATANVDLRQVGAHFDPARIELVRGRHHIIV